MNDKSNKNSKPLIPNSTGTDNYLSSQLLPLKKNITLNRMIRLFNDNKYTLKVLFLSILVGIGAGILCTLFNIFINKIISFRELWNYDITEYNINVMILVVISSSLLSAFGFYIVARFAPEAAGSGIPEIEGAMVGLRPVRWKRVIPAKFFGGISTIGAGLVLGREGPSIQMGASVGRMISDIFSLKDEKGQHILLASGAAAGLSAAFNAPLAGMMFVIEEMRDQFKYNFLSVKSVMLASILATVVYRLILGQQALIPISIEHSPPLISLFYILILGALFGAIGVVFNHSIFYAMDLFEKIHQHKIKRYTLLGAIFGGLFGLLLIFLPDITGQGENLIPKAISEHISLSVMLFLFAVRFLTTILCFSSGAAGGVFAPMLALGALFGSAYGALCIQFFPNIEIDYAVFALAGMAALFSATVRAPITGIILVLELTQEYQLLLPILVSSLSATLIAKALGGNPIYSQLLEKTLAKQSQNLSQKEISDITNN